jgi:NAD(P)-dependent dehydrogenase (short-subunit alcohol dehydrogenase family)
LLKDRVILVTGAGRGIGAAAAKTYAAHGATVLLLGKTEANLTQVYDEIEAAGHPQPAVIPFNLETALPHQYDELAAMIETEFGHLDGLLHNASIIGPRTPIEQLSGENFMRVMQVNVNAMFMLTSTLLPLLKLSQDASVVFTSSSVGRKGRAYWGAYGVSKFATEGLMQTLADEVDAVAPGALQQHQPRRHPHQHARPGVPGRKPAEQSDTGRDHAGLPVFDGSGQHRHQRPGFQRPVMPYVAFVPRRLPVAALTPQ